MAEKDSIRYIKNWWKFQHYKDRRPSWIKLYEEILDDAIIQSLTPPDFNRISSIHPRAATLATAQARTNLCGPRAEVNLLAAGPASPLEQSSSPR